MFRFAASIFSILLAGIVISKSYVDFRARKESLQIFVFWSITWTGIVLVALAPSVVDIVISKFGEGRSGIGTFFGMVLVFLFFIVYRMYVKLDRLEQTVVKAIQDLALREKWKDRK